MNQIDRKVLIARIKERQHNRLNGECVNMPQKVKIQHNGNKEWLLATLSFK